MELCTAMAIEEILKNIKENNRNIVISPVSLNLLLNLLALGSKDRTLEQLLGFLGSKNLSQINKKSSEIMKIFASNEISSVHDDQQLELPSIEDENSEGMMEKEDEDSSDESGLKSLFDLDKIHVSEITNKGPELFCLNAVLVDESVGPLESCFADLAKNIYKAKVQSVDFWNQPEKASEIVNEWIEKGTKGLIKKPTKPQDFKLMTSMVLTNALYFKGEWKVAFNPKLTKQEKFHLLNGETVETFFMMNTSRNKFEYGIFDDFKLLKLPYLSSNTPSSEIRDEDNESRFSLYIFLPHENDGLQELNKGFSSKPRMVLDEFFDKLKYTKLAKLWIPKWKFSHKFKASEAMNEMGLEKPFEIIHKAVIEVNEKGTEAAAYSSGGLCSASWRMKPPLPPPSFVADHPFIFVIREEVSGVLLFLGAVLNPLL